MSARYLFHGYTLPAENERKSEVSPLSPGDGWIDDSGYLSLPSFALASDGTVITWDSQIADLFGVSRDWILGGQGLGYQLYE